LSFYRFKHNTGALQRNEHNSTIAQWTVIRMAIAKNRGIAELDVDAVLAKNTEAYSGASVVVNKDSHDS